MKKYWPLLLIVVVLTAIIGMSQYADSTQRRYEEGARQDKAPSVAGNSDQASNDAKNAYQPPAWAKFVTWPEGVGAWAVILTLLAIAWQSAETRAAAKTSRDAIILQHRPKIVLRNLSLVRQESGGFEIRLMLRNSGATIAHVEEWDFDIMWMKPGYPPEKHTRRIKATTFQPSQTRLYRSTAPELFVRFEASRLILESNPNQEQNVFLGCVALIHYRDEIGTKRDTAITRVYMFRAGTFELGDDAGEAEYSD